RDGPSPGMAAEVARAQKKKNRLRRKDRTTCQGKPRPLIETRFVGESVSSLAIFVEELDDLLIGPRGNLCVNLAPEAMDTFGNGDEFVRNSFGSELLIHLDGEGVWHIRVFSSVN